MTTTPVFFPGEFLRQRSLAGYSPWGCKESDMTEHTCNHREEVNTGGGCPGDEGSLGEGAP